MKNVIQAMLTKRQSWFGYRTCSPRDAAQNGISGAPRVDSLVCRPSPSDARRRGNLLQTLSMTLIYRG
jgi:hypothetical protein